MSSTQHTPGPWLIEVYPTKYPDLKTYTIIAPHGWQEPTGEYSACSVTQGLDNEADARLIATAPDLLATLKTMVALFENNDAVAYNANATRAIDAADRAIAKTQGE